MKILVPVIALAAIAWATAPWVSIALHGTSDQCVLRAMRCEAVIPSPRLPADGERPAPVVRTEPLRQA